MPSLSRTLNFIERNGNRLPNPTLLFIYLCAVIITLSWFFAFIGSSALHPISGETINAKSLISVEGLHYILANTVKNFVQFAPVGSVLLAILGMGIAEHSGLIGSVLRSTVLRAPKKLTTFFVVTASVLSSIALDTGYVIMIPLAGLIFHALGRNPLAGIVAAFAGVSGGFSANILVGPVDAILGGISTEAAQLVNPSYEVSATGNYVFISVSTLLIGLVGTFVTEKIVLRWLPESEYELDSAANNGANLTSIPGEKRGLIATAIASLIFFSLLLWAVVPTDGVLRNPESGSILKSPFMSGIVVLISLYAAICGCVFAKFSQQQWQGSFIVEAMEKHMATMAGYLVLMFFAAQFVYYFSWSQLGTIMAINGADLIASFALPKTLLLISFIFLAAFINLFIGSASAKWALIAPIFVPMFLLLGISPEATQMAYRIGDSSTNIITPLMPYFGVVVAFAQQYKKDIGIGTIISLMLPYSILFLVSWSALLLIWAGFDLPLGPNASIFTLIKGDV